MLRKSHKAILGALWISNKPLSPYQIRGKAIWTIDFMAPINPYEALIWDIKNHPLFVTDDTIGELVAMGYLDYNSKENVVLSESGKTIAKATQSDWWWYWTNHFRSYGAGRPFNWEQYFRTGIIDLTL